MTTDDNRDKSIEYLDLLATTLTQHEKTLDELIEKLGKISNAMLNQQTRETTIIQKLDSLIEKLGKISNAMLNPPTQEPRKESSPTITYSKIEIPQNRPIDELNKILETLNKSK